MRRSSYRPASRTFAGRFRLNHNRFEDTEGRQQTELDLTRGTLTQPDADQRANSARAARRVSTATTTSSI